MTAAIAAPTSGPILALDLGKSKTVACTYDAASALACFTTIPTSYSQKTQTKANRMKNVYLRVA
jgi:hypothetical protein